VFLLRLLSQNMRGAKHVDMSVAQSSGTGFQARESAGSFAAGALRGVALIPGATSSYILWQLQIQVQIQVAVPNPAFCI
jgi:hypothetical protein